MGLVCPRATGDAVEAPPPQNLMPPVVPVFSYRLLPKRTVMYSYQWDFGERWTCQCSAVWGRDDLHEQEIAAMAADAWLVIRLPNIVHDVTDGWGLVYECPHCKCTWARIDN